MKNNIKPWGFFSEGLAYQEYSTGAKKEVESKLRMDLITPEMLKSLATTLTYGAASGKYEERNWENGIPFMQSYASTMRHLTEWLSGVDIDSSGLKHIEQAFINLGFIVTQTLRGRTDLDDRPLKMENPND